MIFGEKLLKTTNFVEGYLEENIEPASIDLRLGNTILVPQRIGGHVKLGGTIKYIEREFFEDQPFILFPGEFVLATTIEKLTLPNNVAAFIQGRSSIGRIGLTTQNAGFVDPGFTGHITLELVNESPNVIELRPGYRIVQAVFFDVEGGTLYNGKYNGQVKATGSKMHEDREVAENGSK